MVWSLGLKGWFFTFEQRATCTAPPQALGLGWQQLMNVDNTANDGC